MTNDDILESLRLDYGVTETQYSDEQLTRFLTKAIRKLSEYYPERGLDHIHTVNGTTRYTVGTGITGFLRVRSVYYGDNQEQTIWNDPDIKESGNTSTFSPSQTAELVSRLELLSQISPRSAEVIGHNQFDLVPTPDVSGDLIYYEYDKLRAIANIPDVFEEDLIDLVFFFSGAKAYNKAVTDATSNQYQFDRRGNVKTGTDVSKMTAQQQRIQQLKDITTRIKNKVMKF